MPDSVDLDAIAAQRRYPTFGSADDDFHDEIMSDRWWETETNWFSWNVPERNIVTAQGSAGKDGKYRLRMPDSQIDYAVQLADQIHGIVILDDTAQFGATSAAPAFPKRSLPLPPTWRRGQTGT